VSTPDQTRNGAPGAPAEDQQDLRDEALYFNRELSWLEFDERVLQLTERERLPLLERVKFSAIFSSNLDEFFMIRVAGLHDQIDAGVDGRGPDGMTANETLDRVREQVLELTARQHRGWSEVLQPALAEHGIRIVRPDEVPEAERAKLTERFERQIFPVLTPLAVGPARPFPYISNLSLSLAVLLRDPVTDTTTFARVKVPKEILGRFVQVGDGEPLLVPLEAVIATNLDALFPGMEILQHGAFRVTRDADVDVSDEADDLVRAVETELRRRRLGEVIRLELERGMDPALREQLVEALGVEERDIYEEQGPLDLGDLMDVSRLRGHQALRYPPWSGVTQPRLQGEDNSAADVFAAMRQGDVLVHHPYDSFATSVERFVEQAVEDPGVLAIKQTVYRTSDDSPLVPALIRATERGKQAVCLVELKARFDERANIQWARRLEESGVHVTYGIPGLKAHAKAILVVRREGDGVRHYIHIGTGNYHPTTARLYTDFGLFTCDPEIGADVADMFNLLTGYARPARPRKVLLAPQYLRESVLDEIRRTIEAHSDAQPARIRLKMNALVDSRCIRALYRASQAGVRVELNVRGICCLRPGVPGISDNIRVVSIVGRFLEHSRVFQFERGGECSAWIGSADLMPRNLDRRVELVTPVEDPRLRDELAEMLDLCFRDNMNAWELGADGEWARVEPGEDGEEVDVHRDLMARHAALATESPAQQEGDRAAI
jgi:polyphosphate kinase